MKIIAKTEHEFLLIATEDEIAKIAGYPYESTFRTATGTSIKVGTQIAVSDAFLRLGQMDCKRREVEQQQAQLRAMADLMDPIVRVIPAIIGEGGAR